MTYHRVNTCFLIVLIVKALLGTFNQEKALVGAFSVIMKSSRTFAKPSVAAVVGVLCVAEPGPGRSWSHYRRCLPIISQAEVGTQF